MLASHADMFPSPGQVEGVMLYQLLVSACVERTYGPRICKDVKRTGWCALGLCWNRSIPSYVFPLTLVHRCLY
jgi:hypothetical protein